VFDEKKWFIIEINETANVDYAEISNAVVTIFGDDVDYFIPIHHEKMGSYISKSILMEGYVFVRNSHIVRENINEVKDQRIFLGPLTIGGKLQTINSHIIGSLRKKLKKSTSKKIKVGSNVEILEGTFKKLIGEVMDVEEDGRKITVRIKRLSREIIAPLPSTIVREVSIV
jgi:transcription antitermination factor NusG